MTSGNTHAPGTAGTPGSQAFMNNLTYAAGSIFAWELTSASTTAGFDQVVGATGKTFTAAGDFRVVTDMDFSANTFWNTQQQWNTIVTGFSTLTGWNTNTPVSVWNSAGIQRADIASYGSFTVTGTTLSWNQAVPEPSSTMIGLLLGAGLIRRTRKPTA